MVSNQTRVVCVSLSGTNKARGVPSENCGLKFENSPELTMTEFSADEKRARVGAGYVRVEGACASGMRGRLLCLYLLPGEDTPERGERAELKGAHCVLTLVHRLC